MLSIPAACLCCYVVPSFHAWFGSCDLLCCKIIGASAKECIAVEDSKSGATAALRAGIPCIAYVGSTSGTAKQDEIGDVLTGQGVGCKVVMHHWSVTEHLVY